MVSSEEINRRLNAKRRGVSYEKRGTPPNTAGTVECPNCHTPNAPAAKFCVNCGEKMETQQETVQSTGSNTKECPNCRFENPESSKFCVKCGEKLETEEEFSPDIKGPESDSEPTSSPTAPVGTTRPDDFSRPGAQKVQPSTAEKKLEPIVPPEPAQEPPQVKRPETIPTPAPQTASPEAKPTTDSDPAEKIKKAKGLLDIDAITQEEFDAIRNKYMEADPDPVEKIKKAKGLLDSGVITQEEFNTIKAKYLDEI